MHLELGVKASFNEVTTFLCICLSAVAWFGKGRGQCLKIGDSNPKKSDPETRGFLLFLQTWNLGLFLSYKTGFDHIKIKKNIKISKTINKKMF